MVCDRAGYRAPVQMIFFVGYMVGSVVFGMLADQYGRRPIMSVSFILMTFSGFLCAFGPQPAIGFWPSYVIFIVARFLLACSTRGISVSGFVLGSEIGNDEQLLFASKTFSFGFQSDRRNVFSPASSSNISSPSVNFFSSFSPISSGRGER